MPTRRTVVRIVDLLLWLNATIISAFIEFADWTTGLGLGITFFVLMTLSLGLAWFDNGGSCEQRKW